MKNKYYIERQCPDGWHIISGPASEKPTINRVKLSIKSYDGYFISDKEALLLLNNKEIWPRELIRYRLAVDKAPPNHI
jgi:hypothetical protein